ncbi:magnesium transporter [Candidatus Aerophobetes bacterium]|nr:magnesium transporter [Candidatus Aerophobetes bacterium]
MEREYSRLHLVLPEIKELIAQKNREELKDIFKDYEPIEVAQVLREFSLKEKVYLFSLWDLDFAADVFEKIDEQEQIKILEAIDDVKKGKLLDELAPDERADLFKELPPEIVDRFLSIMNKEEAQDVKELMSYSPTSAGGIMTTEFASVREDMTAEEALQKLRETAKDSEMVYYIYVVDGRDKLVGVLSLKELILAEPKEKIRKLMHRNIIALPINMDQEEVARKVANYDLLALPVVDENGKMKGIITVDDVIDVIREENTEDMYKFSAAGEHSEEYMKMRPLIIAKNRLTWLIILAFTGFFSGIIMQHFSFVLESIVSLAFYIPVLMDTAGNAGTQAAMAVVRGLAIGEVRLKDIWVVAKKEILIGGMMGIPLGGITLIRAIVLQRNSILGGCVAFSMLIAIITATLLGSLLPLICKKLKLDPAIVSGPLITTVLDVFSLTIYFSVSILFLKL